MIYAISTLLRIAKAPVAVKAALCRAGDLVAGVFARG